MSSIGKNMKWTMSSTLRDRLRTFFEEGLQAKRVKEDVALDAFAFAAGSSIGIEYVEGGKALSAEQLTIAPWIEFLTPKVGEAVERMEKLGLERLEYHDTAHAYFKAPGGIVFRLAQE